MASNRSVDDVVNGLNIDVEVLSKYNNILLVISNSYNLKGILLPVNDENKLRLEHFINNYNKENNNIEVKPEQESLFCIPDSTLSHSAVESNMSTNLSNNNNKLCGNCKRTLKPTKRKLSREVERLTNHGFNEVILKKKNISRRSAITNELINGEKSNRKVNKKRSFDQIKAKDSDLNSSGDIIVEILTPKKEETQSIRKTKERALKTKANEKIIDLCTRKPSKIKENKLELKKKTKKPDRNVDEMLSENSPVKVSDASIYDFVDEDYESEPIKPLYKGNKKSYFIDKSNNSTKLDKRSYQRKLPMKISNNKDDEIHSNPGIMFYEYKGTKFSINNIVWAKIPGYPFWPAHIKSFDNVSASKSQGKRCRINWIGWNQKSFLPLKSLLHFEEHFKVKYSTKFKSQKYKTAIELACKELNLNLDDLIGELPKKSPSPDRNNSSQNSNHGNKRKSIDLDDIFPTKKNSKTILDIDMVAKAYSDEDTDEEEKARSALITAESLEANRMMSDMMTKNSDYDY